MDDKKVLVVEDSPTMRQFIGFSLRRLRGLNVEMATDGVDALKKLTDKDAGFDLILSDINMPVMDGFTLLTEVKKKDSLKGIPVVMLTTEGHEDDIAKGRELGAVGHLTKPINTLKLVTTIRDLLGV
ncbi:MAG: response regulator [Deltaproteobacteria bacterium]|nr:response regulator [Deltaproteobacteria bacterium]